MKKIFIGMSALALSALALTSCGGSSTNDVVLTDAEGNKIDIKATEDATEVSKAIYVLGTNSLKNTTNSYAAGINLAVNANLSGTVYGVDLTAEASLNASVKASLGKNVKYDYYAESNTANDTAAFTKIKNNVKAEATANASIKTTAKAAVLTAKQDDSEVNPLDQIVSLLNNKEVTANGKAALLNGKVYALAEVKLPEELATMANSYMADGTTNPVISANNKYGAKITLKADGASKVSNIIYQAQNAYAETETTEIETTETETETVSTSTESYYDSDAFKSMKAGVEKLGIKISEVKDGNVKFELNATGKIINNLINGTTTESTSITTSSIFDDNTTYAEAYVTIDAKNFRLAAAGAKVNKIGTLLEFASENMGDSGVAQYISMASAFGVDGNVSFDVNLTYDDAVSFSLTESSFNDSDVEYMTTTIGFDDNSKNQVYYLD